MMKNSHILTERFGKIPSFHDAEITRASYDAQSGDKARLEIDLLVTEYSEKTDEKGHFIPKRKSLVTIKFCEVRIDLWKWSSDLDTIYELNISQCTEDKSPKYSNKINLPSVVGGDYGLQFVCNEISVERVATYQENS